MQEHRLQSQQCTRGGKRMTSGNDIISNQAFILEFNQLLRYFVINIFKM
jgi:hypothetical protein